MAANIQHHEDEEDIAEIARNIERNEARELNEENVENEVLPPYNPLANESKREKLYKELMDGVKIRVDNRYPELSKREKEKKFMEIREENLPLVDEQLKIDQYYNEMPPKIRKIEESSFNKKFQGKKKLYSDVIKYYKQYNEYSLEELKKVAGELKIKPPTGEREKNDWLAAIIRKKAKVIVDIKRAVSYMDNKILPYLRSMFPFLSEKSTILNLYDNEDQYGNHLWRRYVQHMILDRSDSKFFKKVDNSKENVDRAFQLLSDGITIWDVENQMRRFFVLYHIYEEEKEDDEGEEKEEKEEKEGKRNEPKEYKEEKKPLSFKLRKSLEKAKKYALNFAKANIAHKRATAPTLENLERVSEWNDLFNQYNKTLLPDESSLLCEIMCGKNHTKILKPEFYKRTMAQLEKVFIENLMVNGTLIDKITVRNFVEKDLFKRKQIKKRLDITNLLGEVQEEIENLEGQLSTIDEEEKERLAYLHLERLYLNEYKITEENVDQDILEDFEYEQGDIDEYVEMIDQEIEDSKNNRKSSKKGRSAPSRNRRRVGARIGRPKARANGLTWWQQALQSGEQNNEEPEEEEPEEEEDQRPAPPPRRVLSPKRRAVIDEEETSDEEPSDEDENIEEAE